MKQPLLTFQADLQWIFTPNRPKRYKPVCIVSGAHKSDHALYLASVMAQWHTFAASLQSVLKNIGMRTEEKEKVIHRILRAILCNAQQACLLYLPYNRIHSVFSLVFCHTWMTVGTIRMRFSFDWHKLQTEMEQKIGNSARQLNSRTMCRIAP